MITINVKSPSGNVLCVLEQARSLQKGILQAGIRDVKLDEILSGYMHLTYDQILDALQTTGYFKFTGRPRKNKQAE